MDINAVNLIRMAALRKRTGHSHSGAYLAMKKGLLPSSIRIGEKQVAWIEHEIDAIVKARIRGNSDDQIRALVRGLEASRAALTDAPAHATPSPLEAH